MTAKRASIEQARAGPNRRARSIRSAATRARPSRQGCSLSSSSTPMTTPRPRPLPARRDRLAAPLLGRGIDERLREQPSMPEYVIDRRLAFAGFDVLQLDDDGRAVLDGAVERRCRVLDFEQDLR